MSGIDFDSIRAAHPLAEIVARYLGAGQRRGGRQFWRCPIHKDKTPSFTLFPNGDGFHCFGCAASGDVLDFIQRVEKLDLKGAIEFLNGTSKPIAVPPKPRPFAPDPDLKRRIARAKKLWSGAVALGDTNGAVYLRERGLLGPFPLTLRFHSALDYFAGSGVEPVMLPALVAAITIWPSRWVEAIQVTFLDPGQPRKAQVSTPRKSFGRVAGGAVRLAPVQDHLLVGEGLETTLSAMQLTGLPGWATCGTAGLRALILPDRVKQVTIAVDADGAGEQAAQVAADRWKAEGRTVRIARPPQGAKDFNDALTGAAYG